MNLHPQLYYLQNKTMTNQETTNTRRPARETVRAEVHSDDYNMQAHFDAGAWFDQASDKEIIDLAEIGWRGDYPADAVAEWTRSHNNKVELVFAYLEEADLPKDLSGFEVSVEEDDALRWVKQNRPHILSHLA